MLKRSLALAFALTALHSAGLAQPAQQIGTAPPHVCATPSPVPDGWKIAAPEEVGIDTKRLCALIDWLDSVRQANVHAVVVVRRNALVFEHYRKGADELWGQPIGEVAFGPLVKHDVRSVSKSVVSLLVGIAIDRRLIAGVEAPVFSFFPEYSALRSAEKDRILIRHLLTMSAGFAWDENIPYTNAANSEALMAYAADPNRFVLEQPIASAPGELFNYSGGATQLLAAIVQKVSGKALDEFAREVLFAPLGIDDFEWVRMPNGEPAAASGLRLKPRDMAKLGQLVLNRGAWNGQRIVSEDWLRSATTAQIEAIDFLFYGYQWWLGRSLIGGREVPWAAAFGLGGQRIFVVPDLELVVVVTAGHYASPIQRWLPWEIFRRHVVGAIRRGD